MTDIDLVKLGKFNGKTEVENAKMIAEILMVKSLYYNMDITLRLVVKEKGKDGYGNKERVKR